MTERPDDDVILILTVRDATPPAGEVVELYQREGRTGAELAQILRTIADGFDHGGELRRIG